MHDRFGDAVKKHRILIAGAGGVVGAAAVDHFSAQPDFEVLALARRPLDLPEGVKQLRVDLTDPVACQKAATELSHVTHILYAALFELPDLVSGWRDPRQMSINDAMLRNLLDAIEPVAKGLRHVSFLQGTKAYGGHVEPAPVPCKERWPRHNHQNFYWLQEDFIRARQAQAAWTFTILRPQVVLGYAVASPMNVMIAIGAFAAILREQGLPLTFPGGGDYVNGASDSRLIAQAAHFAAVHEIAANETYNVVNGDGLVWRDLWPSVAERFGMPLGGHEPLCLKDEMPKYEAVWSRIVAKHGLKPLTLEQLANSSWEFTDRTLGHGLAHPANAVLSGIKLRQHGFAGCIDTEDSLGFWLEKMQSQRLLPR